MKLFRNKNTEEMCVSFTDSKDNLMDFDGNVITCSTEDYEEVNTKPKKHEFHRLHIVEESFDIREFCYKEWHLKDVLYVPVDNGYVKEDVAFRVEHISEEKIYFVAVDAVGKSTMKNMNNFLDDYLKKMPEDLVRNMCEIEHKVEGNLFRRSKLTLLSRGNISDTNGRCNGADDILFDGLLTEAERCKNFDGETEWYWLDTPSSSPNVTGSTYLWFVSTSGSVGNTDANSSDAVVPCFSIQKTI